MKIEISLDIVLSFLTSIFITFIIVNLIHQKLKNKIMPAQGPQKIHKGNISRLGGTSIFLTLFIVSIYTNEDHNHFFNYVLIATPVFILGLIEDVTQSVNPEFRLISSVLSSILFIYFYEVTITRSGIDLFNFLLSYKPISIVFTMLCITYIIQAFNIIDGLNGLSIVTAILSFLSLAFIAHDQGDLITHNFLVILIFILMGVLVFNFPFGKIFIGDSGAYSIGLFVSLSVILLIENHLNVSPFVAVQILIYPAYELIRSIVRRILIGKNIFQPDDKHLHSLLHYKNTKIFFFNPASINSISSAQINILQILNCFYITMFYENEKITVVGIILFILIYEIIYHKLISELAIK